MWFGAWMGVVGRVGGLSGKCCVACVALVRKVGVAVNASKIANRLC